MKKEEKNIIRETIKDLFNLEEKVFNSKIKNDFSLLLAQLDFFKVISSINIGIIGIVYFYNPILNRNFLFMSLLFSIINVVLSISYVREIIDVQSKTNQEAYEKVKEEIEGGVNICIKTLEKNNFKIFYNYAKEKTEKQEKIELPLNYIGETAVFLFYLSISFLIMSLLSSVYSFDFFSSYTLIVIVFLYFLSFKDWAIKISEFLSIKLHGK